MKVIDSLLRCSRSKCNACHHTGLPWWAVTPGRTCFLSPWPPPEPCPWRRKGQADRSHVTFDLTAWLHHPATQTGSHRANSIDSSNNSPRPSPPITPHHQDNELDKYNLRVQLQ
ncbi:uncharacterized protein LOC132204599 [Neocloeon triangulifer]|uniref:uncharacterized protein LOC132204599 n=1 Tax=Neocloeon triangulifer TaxID=2078957 RepID=UPI00286EBAF3|nr:uncharacterized protein LOC132204599 [Neocloeon triangulifer]